MRPQSPDDDALGAPHPGYEANAAPEPVAHKDRFPSQVSVGLSVTIPEASRLVLYPHDHREINPYNRAAALNRSLQPDERPEVVLKSAREIELADRDRDVVMFPGSTTWHLRRRSAGAVNLYFKFNDFGCDPLGEDPHTDAVRAATVAALGGSREEVDALVPVLGRRMDVVSRVSSRATSLRSRARGAQAPRSVAAQPSRTPSATGAQPARAARTRLSARQRCRADDRR